VEHRSIIKLDQATKMLAEVHSIDDAKELIDLAEAARVYAKQVDLGLEAQNHAAEIKIRAQWQAGKLLSKMDKNTGQLYRGYRLKPRGEEPTYSEIGINKRDAHQWQTIASMPEEELLEYLEDSKEKSKEITTADVYRNVKKDLRTENIAYQKQQIENGEAILPEGMFEIIVIDPPWEYGTEYNSAGRRAASPYPEMGLDELVNLNIPASDDCILWLWTTHKFMRHSFDLLDSWGFRDVAILTWVKDRMGLGAWLRSQSEYCIMAVKGKPLISLTNQTTVLQAPMREHSRKPDEFYSMVDELCVGRKLDYFSREQRDGWLTYGNDLEKF
jgi:N6-adenosine-specific RNA methylase IME4